VASSRRI